MPDRSSSSVALLGVPVDNVTMQEALGAIEASIHEGGFHQIATANVDFLINSIHDRELKEILGCCDLVLPDGMPLVWASRLMGVSLRERVSGSDLVPLLVELAAERGYRIFLLGASEESSLGAARWMERNHPRAQLVGRYCPEHLTLEQMDHEDILLQIEAATPDILLVAMGSPKQEKWLAMHRHRLQVPVCIGIGGSLDLLADRLPRAPLWMQRSGLEWLFRVRMEPTRLGTRYARDAFGLLRYMTLQLAATARQKRGDADNGITEETLGGVTVLRISGRLTGLSVKRFEEQARTAVGSGRHLVLDLSRTSFLGPDALGALLHLRTIARRKTRELWLTGLRPFLLRLLHATQLDTEFATAPKISDALRQIQPAGMNLSIESGANWAVCRVDGRTIPIGREEAASVYQQILQLVEKLPVPNLGSASSGLRTQTFPG